MSSENLSTSKTQKQEDEQLKNVKQKVQTCKMFDMFMKDIKGGNEKK